MNISDESDVCRIDTVDWPRESRRIMNEAAGLLTLAMLAAAERARNRCGKAEELLEKEHGLRGAMADLLRRRLKATNPKHRAHYEVHDRCLILNWAAERGWSAKDIAENFAIDESTARLWLQEWRENPDSTLFCGVCAWNSYDVAVKELVHRIQDLFPELDIGARTIANHILKAAIAISRSSVRRYLQDPLPIPEPSNGETIAPQATAEPTGFKDDILIQPFHVLKPEHTNHVWHADFTKITVLWWTFWVTAIMDGFSRRLLALKVSAATPTTATVAVIIKTLAMQIGAPRFIISDRGCQFRETFADLMRPFGIDVIHGRVKHPQFNGKIERFFKTLKLWQRSSRGAWTPDVAFIQRQFDSFREWYNGHRVHQGVQGLTPAEAWNGNQRRTPIRYFARDKLNPVFTVKRLNHHNDRNLPIFDIRVKTAKKFA